MSDNRLFLSVLAKVMQEEAEVPTIESGLYDKLYNLINLQLYDCLNESHYARASVLFKQINKPLADIENYLLCPECFGKTLLQIKGKYPSLSFRLMKSFFNCIIPQEFLEIKTTVPILAVDSKDFSVELMNYANKRIKLTIEEIKILTQSAFENKINLEKLVKYIVVKLPCKIPDITLFFLTISQSSKIFNSFVSSNALLFSPGIHENIAESILKNFSFVIYTNKTYEDLSQSTFFQDIPQLSTDNLVQYMKENCLSGYFGIRDMYSVHEAEINTYYNNQISFFEYMTNIITDDIIRLDNKDKKLESLRREYGEQTTNFLTEFRELKRINKEIIETYIEIEETVENNMGSCSFVFDRVENSILKSLFMYAESGLLKNAESCVSRLIAIHSKFSGLAENYLKCIKNGQTIHFDVSSINQYVFNWASAKMYIAMVNLNEFDQNTIEKFVGLLGQKRLTTGKELYAKAIIQSKMKSRIKYMTRSFEKGYMPAGIALLDYYKNGCNEISLAFLANSLMPEACVMLAKERDNNIHYHDLHSKSMMYYKLAASTAYKPAIGDIADLIYVERFYNIPYIGESGSELEKNALLLSALCTYLIENNYKSMHYTEILGIMQFCLKNYSQSIRLLSGINTPSSNYCKGRMYEYGDGVSIDYSQAISHYNKAKDFKDSTQCAIRVQSKMEHQKQYTSNSYSSSRDYSSSTTSYSSSTSGGLCFITTAAVKALSLDDDCSQLNELRRFRDEYMNSTEEGQELVLEYYRIAPSIVEKLDKLPNSEEEYIALWSDYISPSCNAIQEQKWNEAMTIYINMVRSLADKFEIPINIFYH